MLLLLLLLLVAAGVAWVLQLNEFQEEEEKEILSFRH